MTWTKEGKFGKKDLRAVKKTPDYPKWPQVERPSRTELKMLKKCLLFRKGVVQLKNDPTPINTLLIPETIALFATRVPINLLETNYKSVVQ